MRNSRELLLENNFLGWNRAGEDIKLLPRLIQPVTLTTVFTMTRINVVPVSELCDRHLLSEYRELPRVFALARHCPDAPKEYVLGKGHVKFFYDKLDYLIHRFYNLVDECKCRGFNVNFSEPKVSDLKRSDYKLWNDYVPTAEAVALNRSRLAERISQFKRP